MNELAREKVNSVKQYLDTSSLAEEHKDGLRDMIDLAAEVSNGHSDKIQGITDLLFAMVLQDVRKEVRQPKKIAEEVGKQLDLHVLNCPLSRNPAAPLPAPASTPAPALSPDLPKPIAILYLFRWPAAVVLAVALCFSSQAPAIISLIARLFGQ